jgi:hypothetical protein
LSRLVVGEAERYGGQVGEGIERDAQGGAKHCAFPSFIRGSAGPG